jgi:SAM-dependent methyltransferase
VGTDDVDRLRATRAFFAGRAATWDQKFGDDLPAYAAAVAEAEIPRPAVVLDLGCGTGRALPALRAAVGPSGTVLAIDATPEMLRVATERGRAGGAQLIVADALHLPLADRSVQAVFAAGLLMHLPDPAVALSELGRVTDGTGRLILFHPSGRAALAARKGYELRDDDTLAHDVLAGLLSRTGWQLNRYDDAPHRFFALAQRVSNG